MTPNTFEIDMDAAGTPNAITLPTTNVNGKRHLEIRPPLGNAWTFYEEIGGVGIPRQIDEPLYLERRPGQAPFEPAEIVGYAELASGSGTGYGLLQ